MSCLKSKNKNDKNLKKEKREYNAQEVDEKIGKKSKSHFVTILLETARVRLWHQSEHLAYAKTSSPFVDH